ncbi:RNA polymerase subunit sigma-70 [Hahella sp. CCB-MM4]|uniref:sigma-70 family RNA polymerase sigma factor n=1 Tax=Hahella sp. (strain CCB-MM4) TaxID=1926491 RepID=UPI000B9BE956|nr:sigma-70 family RNA polymerase sigma factor [Hahella sp. CCB-MM4]OZG72753.1 RNA polymerase subunit sigma-70 [Hahella sp. CCB-MM4]
MNKKDWLTESFEEARHHLESIAFRMLGSSGEAEDAVQEAWIRLTRSESEKIENLGGWLTTVVARVCLDKLRSRDRWREEQLDESGYELSDEEVANPEKDILLADSVGAALLVVLDILSPAERIAYVLHDLFDLSFDEIAPVIDRSEAATRKLASRARRRVIGFDNSEREVERPREIISAFLAASREGNFEALIKLLHPDVSLQADDTAVKVAEINKSRGAPPFKPEIKGAQNVANTFKGKAAAAQLALVNGAFGATWAPGGKPVVAFCFSIEGGKITAIEIVMDQKRLGGIDIEIIDSEQGSHL